MENSQSYQLLGSTPTHKWLVLRTAGPLLLAIAGSALTPLPCAFSLSGIPGGLCIMLLIALANEYTTRLLVLAASRLRVTGYEEVMLAAGGRSALTLTRAALVLLLFGTLCGSLAAIQETAIRAAQLAGLRWLGYSASGHALLLVLLAAGVVLPLSLASLGEMSAVSVAGAAMVVVLSAYILACAASHDDLHAMPYMLRPKLAALPEAASMFGYAFYIQPCALPLLRELPAGEEGAKVLVAALRVTFVLTFAAYTCVGIGGYLLFGHQTPQDVLQASPSPSPSP